MSAKQKPKEFLKFNQKGVKGKLLCFTGKSGEDWVSIMPSLNVTGYGKTEKEAEEDIKYNINVFFLDLFSLSQKAKETELLKLGWHKHSFFNKRYGTSYVDENGVLKNFDYPQQVKKTILEPEAA